MLVLQSPGRGRSTDWVLTKIVYACFRGGRERGRERERERERESAYFLDTWINSICILVYREGASATSTRKDLQTNFLPKWCKLVFPSSSPSSWAWRSSVHRRPWWLLGSWPGRLSPGCGMSTSSWGQGSQHHSSNPGLHLHVHKYTVIMSDPSSERYTHTVKWVTQASVNHRVGQLNSQ